jgi:hypothetical protein
MSKIPSSTRNRLRQEAQEWDTAVAGESPELVQSLIEDADFFEARRPVRQLVSLRMEPLDIAMIKRLARRKGIPYTQLMAMWLHERIEKEKTAQHS